MSRMWSSVSKVAEITTPAVSLSLALIICCFWLQTRLAWTAGFQPSATALSRYTSSTTHARTRAQGPSSPAPSCSSSPSIEKALSVTCRLFWFYWLYRGLNFDK